MQFDQYNLHHPNSHRSSNGQHLLANREIYNFNFTYQLVIELIYVCNYGTFPILERLTIICYPQYVCFIYFSLSHIFILIWRNNGSTTCAIKYALTQVISVRLNSIWFERRVCLVDIKTRIFLIEWMRKKPTDANWEWKSIKFPFNNRSGSCQSRLNNSNWNNLIARSSSAIRIVLTQANSFGFKRHLAVKSKIEGASKMNFNLNHVIDRFDLIRFNL